MNGPNENHQERSSDEQHASQDTHEDGHSGEGAASAMAHMISRGRQQRHQTGEPEDAAGSHHQ